MKIQNILAVAGTLVVSCAFMSAAQRNAGLKVDMSDATGKSVGTAVLFPAASGVTIRLTLMNLAPGEHAIHVHTAPKCEGPAFASAGPHLNPDNKHHGLKNPDGPHAGDVPNFTVAADGTAKTSVVAPGVTLGPGANSVFSNGGTSLVIHAKADDNMTDPSGNSGDRIACGVIAKP
jgi:Cu-Zn family superoxide dismutase